MRPPATAPAKSLSAIRAPAAAPTAAVLPLLPFFVEELPWTPSPAWACAWIWICRPSGSAAVTNFPFSFPGSLPEAGFTSVRTAKNLVPFGKPPQSPPAHCAWTLSPDLFVFVLMVPGTILLTPHFILANQLGLRDSLLGLSVFYIAGGQPFAVFLLSAFFQSQPAEMFESARVDGASELRALWSIAVPLSWPIIITLAILNFTSIYNDLIWPMLMLATPAKQTLVVALQRYNPGGGADVISALPDLGGQAAGYAFASIPQLVVFVLGMRYFIQGLTSGAVKG